MDRTSHVVGSCGHCALAWPLGGHRRRRNPPCRGQLADTSCDRKSAGGQPHHMGQATFGNIFRRLDGGRASTRPRNDGCKRVVGLDPSGDKRDPALASATASHPHRHRRHLSQSRDAVETGRHGSLRFWHDQHVPGLGHRRRVWPTGRRSLRTLRPLHPESKAPAIRVAKRLEPRGRPPF